MYKKIGNKGNKQGFYLRLDCKLIEGDGRLAERKVSIG